MIALDRTTNVTLPTQIANQLRSAILDGAMPAGSRLPSTRSLAATLSVSRNVIVSAYDDLMSEGCVDGSHGSGTFVSVELSDSGTIITNEPSALIANPRWPRTPAPLIQPGPVALAGEIEFRPGKPSTDLLSTSAWRRMWRAVADAPPPSDYGPPAGYPPLRSAIAGYATVVRCVRCQPNDVIVTTGAVQAIDLVARATVQAGDSVGFEEPGPAAARNMMLGYGARIVAVPVDQDGLRVDRLPTGMEAAGLVFVTPPHQYPLGARMSAARRLALIQWAWRHDSLVIEDDYNAEFHYGAPPLPALADLAPRGHVIDAHPRPAHRPRHRVASVARANRGVETTHGLPLSVASPNRAGGVSDLGSPHSTRPQDATALREP